jgi:hypothetical protein
MPFSTHKPFYKEGRTMFCAVRVAKIEAKKVTDQVGGVDEVYFVLSGGSAANMKPGGTVIKRKANPDIWQVGLDKPPPHHITLWQGFIANSETAVLNVIVREQDPGGAQLLGRFKVSITATSPQPAFLWEADSAFTSIEGSAHGSQATISARESQAEHELTLVVDQGRTITNVNSNTKCLDVKGGSGADNTNVQQFECHGGPNQKWFLRPWNQTPPTEGVPPDAGELGNLLWAFLLHADHSGKCLDVEDVAPDDDGSRNVQQFHPHSGENQRWFILRAEEPEEFFIISAWGFAGTLDVEGESKESGANVQVFPFNGNANQRWRINPPPLIVSTDDDDEVWNLIRD